MDLYKIRIAGRPNLLVVGRILDYLSRHDEVCRRRHPVEVETSWCPLGELRENAACRGGDEKGKALFERLLLPLLDGGLVESQGGGHYFGHDSTLFGITQSGKEWLATLKSLVDRLGIFETPENMGAGTESAGLPGIVSAIASPQRNGPPADGAGANPMHVVPGSPVGLDSNHGGRSNG